MRTPDGTSGGQGEPTGGTDPGPLPEPPWVGAWLGAWPTPGNRALETFHGTSGVRLDVVDLYVSWQVPAEDVREPLQRISAAGARPLVTWQPVNLTTDEITAGSTELVQGENRTTTVDAYIDSFARVICETAELTGEPVLVRPMGDPNGDWQSWSIGWTDETGEQPNTPESYKAAWTHVHDGLDEACPGGTELIWSINHVNIGNGTGYTNTYPGNDTVDHVGISGFNWGDDGPFGWQSFDAVYSEAYCNVTATTDAPVILTALGTSGAGGDKPAWIQEAFQRVASGVYNVSGMVWFHDTQALGPEGPPADLRLNSTEESQAAFVDSLQAMRAGRLVEAGATWEICEASTS